MKIGYVGAYCTANFGDWAILVNNIFDFKADENVIFTYSNSFPHRAVMNYCAGKNVKFVEVNLREEDKYTQPLTPYECMRYVSNIEDIRREIRAIDVLCVSGGGYWDDNWCSRTDKFIKIVVPIIVAQEFGKKIVFMAQGIGPIVETKESMRFLFNFFKEANIAIRDDYCSASYLRELGVNEKKIHLLPDDLLFINNALIKTNREEKNKEKYVVVVLHDSMERVKSEKELFIKFAEDIKVKYGLKVVFLPFDLVWYGYDQSRYLSELIDSASMVNYEKFLPIEEAYSLVENADLVLTGRYHASILAQQTNTPFIVRLGESKGGRTYAYNKLYGSLKNLFKNCTFEENYFMGINWSDIFKFVTEEFENIVRIQKVLYEDSNTIMNRQYLRECRENYIQKYIIQE